MRVATLSGGFGDGGDGGGVVGQIGVCIRYVNAVYYEVIGRSCESEEPNSSS